MIAFSCNIGGVATPVGTPPNLIAIGMFERILEYRVSFFDWMRFGVPIAGASFVFLYLLVRWLYCRREERIEGAAETIRRERATLGPWRPGEVVALCSFLLAVVLWTVPGVLSLALGREAPLAEALDRMLPEASSAILAAALLFLIPVDWKRREFALDWREAARIDWGTILLFGGGLSLGSLAFSTGLARALGAGVLERSGALPVWLAALLALYTANVLTEFMSNTATANLLIPMFLALAGTGAALPGLPALAATVGCSYAFCLPVATPPNAIVYGSGLVPLSRMIRLGVLLDLGCGLIAWALLLLIV